MTPVMARAVMRLRMFISVSYQKDCIGNSASGILPHCAIAIIGHVLRVSSSYVAFA